MGNKKELKLAILAGLLLLTALIAYSFGTDSAPGPKPPLLASFTRLEGYQLTQQIDLAPEAYAMLRLDDYLFADYSGNNQVINLYVGLYYSAAQAYAAHSPLVCYPSQGWEIENRPAKRSLEVGPYVVNYEEIVTSYNDQRELVTYWYQAHDRSSTQVYRNKIDMAYNKIRNKDESHAFIRVSVPFAASTRGQAQEATRHFIQAFLPRFIDYLDNSNS